MEKQNPSERMELDATILDIFVVDITLEQLNHKRPTIVYTRDRATGYILTISMSELSEVNEHDGSSLLQDQTPSSPDTAHKNEGDPLNETFFSQHESLNPKQ